MQWTAIGKLLAGKELGKIDKMFLKISHEIWNNKRMPICNNEENELPPERQLNVFYL